MKRVEFLETTFSKPASIDRTRGILRGVKIVGNSSQHNRTYPTSTLQRHAALYEGMLVNNNHFRRKGEDLPTDVRFGWLENVTAKDDGLYADCHLFDPAEPLARKLYTAAEHKPNAFGFSHHAFGSGRQVGAQFVVEAIESVASVDLVAEPATTKGLFESGQKTMYVKIKDLFESLSRNATLDTGKRKRLCELLEMAPEEMKEPMAGQEMEEPAADVPADQQIGDAFKAMVCGVFDDSSLDAKGKIKKIGEILKAQEKLMGVDAEVAAEGDAAAEEEAKKKEEEEAAKGKGKGEGEEDAEKKEEEKAKMESLVRENAILKAKEGLRILIEGAGVKFQSVELREAFVASLLPLNEVHRKALIDERKSLLSDDKTKQTPRSRAPGQMVESQPQAMRFPKSRDEVKKLIALN